MTPNMTEERLEAVFKALPEEMDEGELCALVLCLYSAYLDEPSKVITELIATIYTFGRSCGMAPEVISEGLRRSAEMLDQKPIEKTH